MRLDFRRTAPGPNKILDWILNPGVLVAVGGPPRAAAPHPGLHGRGRRRPGAFLARDPGPGPATDAGRRRAVRPRPALLRVPLLRQSVSTVDFSSVGHGFRISFYAPLLTLRVAQAHGDAEARAVQGDHAQGVLEGLDARGGAPVLHDTPGLNQLQEVLRQEIFERLLAR